MIVPANTLPYYSQVWLRHDKVLKGWSLHKGDVQNIFYILTDIRLLQQKKSLILNIGTKCGQLHL